VSAPGLLGAGVGVTVLTVESEETLGSVLVRWVRAPLHLDDSCGCGDGTVMVAAADDTDLWCALAVLGPGETCQEGRDRLMEGLEWERSTAQLAAAFGWPWAKLTVPAMRGQLVLGHALEDETLLMLVRVDPERLLDMRLTCTQPADMVRALRLMREHARRSSEGPPR
jgi:hypothetical protein